MEENFLATGAVMVRTDDEEADRRLYNEWGEARGIGAAYVTFQPGQPSSIERASEWLEDTYVRGVMCGQAVTDFDEQVRRFRDATFGLEVVLQGRVPVADARDVLDRCSANEHTRRLVIEKLEINGGLVMAGDQYNVGQAGAVGPGAHAENMTLAQGTSNIAPAYDPAALGAELEQLRAHLRSNADDPEHDAALGIVAQAELTAKTGDGQGAIEQLTALKRLGNAGRWVLTAATNIGTTVAAEALKGALGL